MTTAELGQKLKRLHPEYAEVDDARLGRAMMRRFPGLYHATDDLDSNTVPETPGTLKAQLNQLKSGLRRCVFIARGSKAKVNPKDYDARRMPSPAGDFIYDPKAITPKEIKSALENHDLPSILGAADGGYGTPDKHDLRGPVAAVVARNATGETVQGALTDPAHEQSAVEQAQKVTPQGGAVSVEPPAKEIHHRATALGISDDQSLAPKDSPESGASAEPLDKRKALKAQKTPGGRWKKPGA